MGLDKLIDSARLDGALSATATAILLKTGGSTPLTWDMDEGFADIIEDIPTQVAQTITPTTSNQTISSGTFLTGDQTILGDTNLVASNIASGISIFGVTGTFAGGGDDLKNFIELHETMSSFSNSTISVIGKGAFAHCSSLKTVSIPSCKRIYSYAFQNCYELTTASFSLCTSIGSAAFQNCTSLVTISFPLCTRIESNAFQNCLSLVTVSFSLCTSIGSYAFQNCYSLTTISLPLCTSIGNYAFQSCYNLTTVSFPSCTSMGNSTFYYCSGLTTAIFPLCTNIGSYAFQSCYNLTTVSFSLCTSIGSNAFINCSSLTTVSFPSCTSIGSSAFYRCYHLLSLYLTGSSIVYLQNSNVFSSTPIAGYTASTGGVYGSIFVPSSLYSTYIASTNWTYFSSRFVSV